MFKSLFFVSRWSVFSSKSLEKGQVFSFLVLTGKKSLRFLFSRIVKSVLVQSTVTIWGKLVLWRFVFFFFVGNWIKISCLLAREKKRHYQKIIVSRRSIRMLEKLENAQVFSFLVLGAKKKLQSFLGRHVESVLVLSRATFWGNLYFLEFFFFLGFWLKFLCLMANETKPGV